MPQVWIPTDALVEGKLPPVCLVTGTTEGVTFHGVDVPWSSSGARGTSVHPAVSPLAFSGDPTAGIKLPMTDEGLRRYQLSRKTGAAIIGSIASLTLLGAGLTNTGAGLSIGFGLGVAGAITYAVYFGRGTSIAMIRRRGAEILVEVSNEDAAAALSRAFPQTED